MRNKYTYILVYNYQINLKLIGLLISFLEDKNGLS